MAPDRGLENRLATIEKDVRDIQARINQLHENSMKWVNEMLEETRKMIREETERIRDDIEKKSENRISIRAQAIITVSGVVIGSMLSTISAILIIHIH